MGVEKLIGKIQRLEKENKSQQERIRELEGALEIMCRKHRETHGLDGAYDKEITRAEQALRNAKQE